MLISEVISSGSVASYDMGDSAVIDVDGRKIRMVKSKLDRNDHLVMIDLAKFDPAFARERQFYIGPGGTGNQIRDRYPRFQEFLKDHDTIEVSDIYVDENGRINFGNGRHRYSVLRDKGVRYLPVVMPAEAVENAARYGYLVPSYSGSRFRHQ